MKDKKIVYDWLPPFDMLAKDRELQRNKTKNSAVAEFKKGTKKKELLTWWTSLRTARTVFEQGSAI
jgi:hypothetical protein